MTIDPKIDYAGMVAQVFATRDDILSEQAAGMLAQQWQLRSLADAYTERPPREFLVDGLLPLPSLSIVYGAPGSLKSMLLADMAVCVASGERWLDATDSSLPQPGQSFSTRQAPVLWVDFDNGRRSVDEIFDAFARARHLPVDTPIHYVSMPTPWLDVSNRSMVIELSKLITHLKAKLIVIDNLGLVTGDVEENSASMSQPMGNLRWLCEETESAVILVHHQRKSSGSTDSDTRKGDRLRGSSAIEAALNLALLVERKTDQDVITVTPTKVRGFRAMESITAQFTYLHRDGTYDMEMARFFSLATETKNDRELQRIRECVLRILRDAKHAPSQKELVNEVRDRMAVTEPRVPGVNRVRGAIKDMVEDGVINEFEGEKEDRGATPLLYGILTPDPRGI